MNCNQFKDCHKNGVEGILALTRAERNAMAKHWTECFECRDWTMSVVLEVTSEQQLRLEMLKVLDRQDSELVRFDQKEIARFDLDEPTKTPEKKEKV